MVAAAAPAHFPAYAQAKRTVGVLLPRDADAFWTVFRAAMLRRQIAEAFLANCAQLVCEVSAFELAPFVLVGLNVALIVAHQTPAAQAARAATREIPIVAAAGDLVATVSRASLILAGTSRA
jgi:hypothetical protein